MAAPSSLLPRRCFRPLVAEGVCPVAKSKRIPSPGWVDFYQCAISTNSPPPATRTQTLHRMNPLLFRTPLLAIECLYNSLFF